jgi:hypothetical protein
VSYRCPFCGRIFPFTGIKNHLKHCLEDTFPVHVYRRKCLACGREFRSWSGLSVHLAYRADRDIWHALLTWILLDRNRRSHRRVSRRVLSFLAQKPEAETRGEEPLEAERRVLPVTATGRWVG